MEAFNSFLLWAQTGFFEIAAHCFLAGLLTFLLIVGVRERRAHERADFMRGRQPPRPWTDSYTPTQAEMASVKDYARRVDDANQKVIEAKENAEQIQILKDEVLVIGAKFTNDPEIGGILVNQHENPHRAFRTKFTIADLRKISPDHRGDIFRMRDCRLVDGDTFEDPAAGEAYDRIQKRVKSKRIQRRHEDPIEYDDFEMETQHESDLWDFLNEPIGSEDWYQGNIDTCMIIDNIGHYMSRDSMPGVRPSKATMQLWLECLAEARDQAHHENGGAQAKAAANTMGKQAEAVEAAGEWFE